MRREARGDRKLKLTVYELVEAGEDALLPVDGDGLERGGGQEGGQALVQVVRERDALVNLSPLAEEWCQRWSSEWAQW